MAGAYIHESNGNYFETLNGQNLQQADVPEGFKEALSRPSVHHEYNYETSTWILNESLLQADMSAEIRDIRNRRLRSEVDMIAGNSLRWNELSSEKKDEWSKYRTDLLNVPQQNDFPLKISWPSKPS